MKKSILTAAAFATLLGMATAGTMAFACGGAGGACTCGHGTAGAGSCGGSPAKTEDKTPPAAPATEKCYGVVKAGLNDCHAPGHSCAGLGKKDADKDEYVELPVGVCDKLIGGSLKKS